MKVSNPQEESFAPWASYSFTASQLPTRPPSALAYVTVAEPSSRLPLSSGNRLSVNLCQQRALEGDGKADSRGATSFCSVRFCCAGISRWARRIHVGNGSLHSPVGAPSKQILPLHRDRQLLNTWRILWQQATSLLFRGLSLWWNCLQVSSLSAVQFSSAAELSDFLQLLTLHPGVFSYPFRSQLPLT